MRNIIYSLVLLIILSGSGYANDCWIPIQPVTVIKPVIVPTVQMVPVVVPVVYYTQYTIFPQYTIWPQYYTIQPQPQKVINYPCCSGPVIRY